jgi:hypothetical protein
MNCVECRELLVGYIEKILDAEQGETVRGHLKDCHGCRKELKQIMSLQNRLVANGRLTNQNDLENAVMDRIVREQAFKLRETNQNQQQANIWRLIMRSPITKLAMAAVVIIAVGLAIYYFAGGGTKSCCAWPLIADKVAQIKTCVYSTHVRQTIGPQGSQIDVNGISYLSSEYGNRSDTYMNGSLAMQMYMRTDDKVSIMVMPSEKKYMRMVLTDEMLNQSKKQSQDPRDMLTTFMTGQIKELGTKVIDNVEVKGMEVVDPPSVRGVYGSFIGRLWVDVATEYPVSIEIETEIGTGADATKMQIVMDDFVWGEELDPGVFEPNIPADYTMMAEVKMPGQDEASAIEGLRAFAEITDGRYPSQMNVMTLTKESAEVYGKKFGAAGTKPTDEQMQQMTSTMVKFQAPVMFYTKLARDGNDPNYYGKDVTAGDANAVLMTWKISNDSHRVIYGDLSVENVSAEQFKEMEQPAKQ